MQGARQGRRSDRPPPDKVARKSPWILVGWMAGFVAAVFLLLLAVDLLLLRGQEIFSQRGVRFELLEDTPDRRGSDSPEMRFLVEREGVRHTVFISSFPQELMLRWTVTSPEGWVAATGRDILRTDGRRAIEFVPRTKGTYLLRIDRVASQPASAYSGGIIAPPEVDRVHVSVRTNDRTILPRLFSRRSLTDRLLGVGG